MGSLYLPAVENAGPPGTVAGITHLIAYRPGRNTHLLRFAQGVMRGESPLSPGLRELIAAVYSDRNGCCF